MNYTQNGTDPNTGAPIYTQNTTLTPEMEQLFKSQTQSQQGVSDAISGAIGRLPSESFNPNIDTSGVRQRSFDSQMAMLNPEFEKGATQLEGTMSDRGIPIGSSIWNDQQGEYNRAKDSSLLAAGRTADLDASNEHQRLYGNALNEYNLPLQQLSALMGNSSAVQNPSFNPFAQSSAAGTDTASNVWNAYKANTEAANTKNSAMMNGVLGLGKLAMAIPTGGSSLLLPQLGPGTGAFG